MRAQYKEAGIGTSKATESFEQQKGRLLTALKECSRTKNLGKGRELHLDMIAKGYKLDIYVSSSLVDMYAKCGRMADAKKVFDAMDFHDVVTWNALMFGYVENDEPEVALALFEPMAAEDCAANSRTLVAALKACTSLATKEEFREVNRKQEALEKATCLHSQAGRISSDEDIYVASCLVDLYAKCGCMIKAQLVFDGMKFHNEVSWHSLMLGYADNGKAGVTLELYEAMEAEACQANARTFVAVLKACALVAAEEVAQEVDGRFLKMASLERGMATHSRAVNRKYSSDPFVSSALVAMYAKCGSMVDARAAFDRIIFRDMVSWTALVLGYAENGQGNVALELLARCLQHEVRRPDDQFIVAALKTCSCVAEREQADEESVKVQALETGMAIHALAAKLDCVSNVYVANSLVDFYAKCGSIRDAQRVFCGMKVRVNTVSWNALILGYADNGEGELALEVFEDMLVEKSCQPDTQTFVAALKACIVLAAQQKDRASIVKWQALEAGMAIDSLARKASRCDSDTQVASNLVEMYSKCGSLFDARRVFDSVIQIRAAAPWNSLVVGYVENGEDELGLELFQEMRRKSLSVDSRAYAAVLKACNSLAALELGRSIHGEICKKGLDSDPSVTTHLVDLYGKCGNTDAAQLVFNSAPAALLKNVAAWNVLLSGFSRQGNHAAVLELFREMLQSDRCLPNAVSFLAVLSACRHAGLVDTGKKFFDAMPEKYGVDPQLEHFHSTVDLLGRGNRLDEALELVESMPHKNAVTWTTLLSASSMWRNEEIGRLSFERLVALDKTRAAAYVLMAGIYESKPVSQ